MAGNRRTNDSRERSKGRQRPSGREGASRRPRKKTSLAGPIIAGVAVAVIAFAGKYMYDWDQRRKALEAEQQKEDVKMPAAPPSESRDRGGAKAGRQLGGLKEKEGAPAPTGARKKAVVTEPSDTFLAAVEQGRSAFRQANFQKAFSYYSKAAESPAPPDKVQEVSEIARACGVFDEITKDVKVSVETVAEGLYWIKLKERGRFRAKVTHQDDKVVRYIKDGIRGEFAKSDIESMEPITQKTRDTEMRRKLEKQKAEVEKDGLSYYLLAVQALEYDFRETGASLLKQAYNFEKEAGRDLAQTIREFNARKLFKQGAWFHSLGIADRARRKFEDLFETYPGTQAAKLAREILEDAQQKKQLAEAQRCLAARRKREAADEAKRRKEAAARVAALKEEPKDPAPRPGSDLSYEPPRRSHIDGKDKENIQKGLDEFEKGLQLVVRGRDVASAKKSNSLYKEAQGHLEAAQSALSRAADKEPGNQAIQDKLQEVTMQLYWCRKMQRLGI